MNDTRIKAGQSDTGVKVNAALDRNIVLLYMRSGTPGGHSVHQWNTTRIVLGVQSTTRIMI